MRGWNVKNPKNPWRLKWWVFERFSKWQPGHSRQPICPFSTPMFNYQRVVDSTRSRKSKLNLFHEKIRGIYMKRYRNLTFWNGPPKSAKAKEKPAFWKKVNWPYEEMLFNSEIGCRSWSPSNGTDTNFKSPFKNLLLPALTKVGGTGALGSGRISQDLPPTRKWIIGFKSLKYLVGGVWGVNV